MSQTHINIIKKQFPKGSFYLYMPGLTYVFGSTSTAIMIGYLLFWKGKGWSKDGEYKTVSDCAKETGLSRHQQTSAINQCVKAGFLVVKLKGLPRKRHFNLDVTKLENYINSHPKTVELYIRESDEAIDENQTTITKSKLESKSEEIINIYNFFLSLFCLSEDRCRLTDNRRLMLIERLSELGYERLRDAVRGAYGSDYWTGRLDGEENKITFERIFRNYEDTENFANLYDDRGS